MISLNAHQHQQPLLHQCEVDDRPNDDIELDHFFSVPLNADTDGIYQLESSTASLGENPIKLEDSGWSEENAAWPAVFQPNRPVSNFNCQSSIDSSSGVQRLFTSPSHMEVDGMLSSVITSSSGVTTNTGWKMNHSEVEKQRRDKMNTYIFDIAGLVPMCRSATRKLDKLTVLRMTAQHLKTMRQKRSAGIVIRGGDGGDIGGCGFSGGDVQADPEQLFSSPELQRLIQNNFDGFTLVVSCDRARILYAASRCDAASTTRGQEFAPHDLIGLNLVDIVHPKDVKLVKEQIALPECLNQESELFGLMHWARRSFYCRFRTDIGTNARRRSVRQYEHMLCTGFVHWPTGGAPQAPEALDEGGIGAAAGGASAAASEAEQLCPGPAAAQLVLLCRPAAPADLTSLPARFRPADGTSALAAATASNQFHARLSLDGRIAWVEQRVAPLLGHLPQDLLDTSLYDLVSRSDLHRLSVAHASALKAGRSRVTLQHCRLRSGWASGEEAPCSLSIQCFANPLSQKPEFLSLTGTLTPESQSPASTSKSDTVGRRFHCRNAATTGGLVSDEEKFRCPVSQTVAATKTGSKCQVVSGGGVGDSWQVISQLIGSIGQPGELKAHQQASSASSLEAVGVGDGSAAVPAAPTSAGAGAADQLGIAYGMMQHWVL